MKKAKEEEDVIAEEVKGEAELVKEIVEVPVAKPGDWIPKTDLGNKVLKGHVKSLEDILAKGEEIIYIGGSPGKGGGIKRTATKRTARMHKSGRRFNLSALIVVGDEKGIVGLGKGKSREHRIAIEKATKQAKLNVIRVRKGCGNWECACGTGHSIPFRTEAKYGSVTVKLLPAPKGVGIVADNSSKKLLKLAGIKDIWVKTLGNTGARQNLIYAGFIALKNLNSTKGDL